MDTDFVKWVKKRFCRKNSGVTLTLIMETMETIPQVTGGLRYNTLQYGITVWYVELYAR